MGICKDDVSQIIYCMEERKVTVVFKKAIVVNGYNRKKVTIKDISYERFKEMAHNLSMSKV